MLDCHVLFDFLILIAHQKIVRDPKNKNIDNCREEEHCHEEFKLKWQVKIIFQKIEMKNYMWLANPIEPLNFYSFEEW